MHHQTGIPYLRTDVLWRRAPRPSFYIDQKDWLTRAGALTRHLRRLGCVGVCVLREAADFAWPDEAVCLGMRTRLRVWAREVLLRVDGIPYVATRCVTPLAASHGAWRAIRYLGVRPLADVVYKADVQRSAFISQRVDLDGRLGRFIRQCTGLSRQCYKARMMVARRSVFIRRGAPLLATECFLTALWAHLAAHGGK